MPAVSKKQERFMQAVANNPKFAKKVGVPTSVGKEFTKKEGGVMKESKAMMKKEVSFMKKKGAPKSMIKHEKKEAGMEAGGVTKKMPTAKQMGSLGLKSGGMKKMASGGMPMVMKDGKKIPAFAADGQGKMKHGGSVKKMAGGGLAGGHKSADGIAKKGKTDTKMVKMAKGGRYC
jgi:hypothetical protein